MKNHLSKLEKMLGFLWFCYSGIWFVDALQGENDSGVRVWFSLQMSAVILILLSTGFLLWRHLKGRYLLSSTVASCVLIGHGIFLSNSSGAEDFDIMLSRFAIALSTLTIAAACGYFLLARNKKGKSPVARYGAHKMRI